MGALTAFDLNNFINLYQTKIYFETGTGEAVSLSHAIKYKFDKYYTVDIDTDLINAAKSKLSTNPAASDITFIDSTSNAAIDNIVPMLDPNVPVLWFLDAHFPGADFHKITYEQSIRHFGKDAFPLESEITKIASLRDCSRDVFVIDDFVLYESGDYDSIREGMVWQYNWLQKELDLETNSKFIYDTFNTTHIFTKDLRHQGYLIITPKPNTITGSKNGI